MKLSLSETVGKRAVLPFFLANFACSAFLHRYYRGNYAALAKSAWAGSVVVGESDFSPYPTVYLVGRGYHCGILAAGVEAVVAARRLI
ncbi:MAG: hypothetical protein IPJ90_11835 [Anaerolineaceae bacterium]|nr:hypothetical protein [Anaerolineaceae bacterium]